MFMRSYLALVLLTGGQLASGQSTFLVRLDSVQDTHTGIAWAVKEVADGYLVFGQQYSHDSTGRIHVFVRKLDLQGHFLHEREFFYGDTCNVEIQEIDPITIDIGGSFVGTMTRSSSIPYELSFMLFEFDTNGDSLESHSVLNTSPFDSLTVTIRQTRTTRDDGYVMVGGHTPVNMLTKAMLLRTNAEGDTLWMQRYGADEAFNTAMGTAEFWDGGFLLTGVRFQSFVQDDCFLIRTDSLGNQLWRREFGEDASVSGAVRMTPDSNIVTWSEFKEDAWPNYWQQALLTKWDSAGSIIWQKKSHFGYNTVTMDIEVLPDNGFVCSGTSNYQALLARFDANGDSLWSRAYDAYDGPVLDVFYDVTPTSDGGFVLCGYGQQDVDDPYPGMKVMFIVKTDSFGCVVPGCQNVGVQEYELGLQDRLRVAPNPASERVNLELELPAAYVLNSPVSVIVFDAAGREVLRETVPHSGALLSHTLHVTDWPPGLYHLHLADQCKWLAGAKVVVE